MKKEKLFTITQAARALEMGRNNLLKLLRNHDLLHSREPLRNSPTKTAVKQGLMVAENAEFNRGPVKVPYINTKVTSKGMVWIRDLLEKENLLKAS
ncbi:hypothetical protein Misp06_04012 [Microbulbifer sp. NBRC 101763]|uniref:phage antirepressor KilAC domain-containing protein n=1 Tax=Microbulbifer sp. NBRC 101763 TaxID=1113820 RepID=UPI0030A294B6